MQSTATRRTRLVVATIALTVIAGAGAAGAAARYDADNAHRVDGRHAVGAGASKASRAGKLVTTGSDGRFPTAVLGTAPDSRKLGGHTHEEMSALSIAPQGTHVSGSTTQSSSGPSYSATAFGEMRVGFVVPPDHGDRPLTMRVVYLDSGTTDCQWQVSTSGLEGPDGPNSQANVHNGGWLVPGTNGYDGYVTVPAGQGSVHSATFTWPFQDDPGMFIQFAMGRNGADPADTCGGITVVGLELRY